jgi:Transposase DDE domain group 1
MSRKQESELLPLEISPEPAPEVLTALGGLPLVLQTIRTLGVLKSIEKHVKTKQRERGFTEAQMVQSLVALLVAGGECPDDLNRLRADAGVPTMLGHAVPAPETARKFLYAFHKDEAIQEAKEQRKPGQIAFIAAETEPLVGLGQVNVELVKELGRRLPQQRIGTVDQDATVQLSHKKEALPTYEGGRGYQPMVACWAEVGCVLADEFRDGNVPAGMETLTVAQRAFHALPETVTQYYYRADSGSYDWTLLDWLRNPNRPQGPRGRIGFAISADMTPPLREAIVALPPSSWTPYQAPGQVPDEQKDWAEVPYVPTEPTERKDAEPLRYVAIRLRPRQGELFADGTEVKYFAVVSNRWELEGAKLLQWHPEKAGTIEHVHDGTKNELGGGVLPCGRFGANAAWWRLVMLAHNVLVALKHLALPPQMLAARPKRLRFEVIVQAGRLVHHARTWLLRLCSKMQRVADYIEAWRLLRAPAPA